MIGEQEAVRGRLFTIQDVMQSTVRAWLQVFSTSMIGTIFFLRVGYLFAVDDDLDRQFT